MTAAIIDTRGRIVVYAKGIELFDVLLRQTRQASTGALQSADDAADSAAVAQLAESGAVAANGTLRPDTATGLAATDDNGYFTVAGDGTNTYAILYRKVSGAAIEIAQYASKAAYEGPGGAGLVSFTQAWSGAVTRTILDAMGDRVSVLDFIPTALHDDIRAGTDETDLSPYFVAALTTGRALTVPAGRYHVSISLPSGAKLIGEGRELTTIRNVGNAPVFTIDSTTQSIRGVILDGMTIRNRDKAIYQDADGIYIVGPEPNNENDYHIFHDLLIFQFRYNAHLKGRSIWNRWCRVSFVEAILDGFFSDADDNQAVQTFDTCRWAANGRYGMRVVHTFEPFLLTAWTFINCNFENNLWVPIRIGGTFGIQNWTFIGCYAEENTNSIPPGTNDGVVKAGFLLIDSPYAFGLVVLNCTFANNTAPHPNPDYYIYVADTCVNVFGSVDMCRGGTANVVSVYWKRNLDFGFNFNMSVEFDRALGSRNAADSVTGYSFMPSVAFSGGSAGVTHSNRQGWYVINGGLVTFQAYVSLSSKGSSAGAVHLLGLPVPAKNVANLLQTVSVVMDEASSTKSQIHGQIGPGETKIDIQGLAAGSLASVTDAELGNFTTFRISGSYML